jgi:hypothetical protein
MITQSKLNEVLSKLSEDNDPDHLLRNHTIFGEILSAAFPSGSALSTAYEALGKRLSGIHSSEPTATDEEERDGQTGADPEKRRATSELQELARAANTLLGEFGPSYAAVARSNREREIEQLVNQAFYRSQTFNFTKWVLIIGLTLIGIGSASYAGFSLSLWDRAKEAQKSMEDANDKYNDTIKQIAAKSDDLQRKQQDAITAMQKAQDSALNGITELITRESNEIQGKFQDALNASTQQLKEKFKTASDNADTMERNLQGQFATVVQEGTGSLNAVVKKNTDDLNAIAAKSTKDLDAAAKKSTNDLDAIVASQSQVLAAAATKGEQTITADVPSRIQSIDQAAANSVTSLSNRTEKGQTAIDKESEKGVAALDAASKEKLSLLNRTSDDVAKKLDAISTDSQTAETQFTGQLKQRLASWDQRIDSESGRVDGLAKSVTDLKSNTDRLDQRLNALQNSSSAALKVAEQLKAGTSTGDLEKIGSVLENTAVLILLGLGLGALGFVGLILAIVGLFLQCRRHQEHQQPARPH